MLGVKSLLGHCGHSTDHMEESMTENAFEQGAEKALPCDAVGVEQPSMNCKFGAKRLHAGITRQRRTWKHHSLVDTCVCSLSLC